MTLPRKMGARNKESLGSAATEEISQDLSGSSRHFHSLPRPKTKHKPSDHESDAAASVRNLVSLFEKRRDIPKNDDNIEIISPPLEFVDNNHNLVKTKSRTDFVGDILNIDKENVDDDHLTKITQHLYTTLLSKLVMYRDKLNSLSSDYETLSRDLRDLDNKLINRAPYHVVDKYRVHLADTDRIVR